MRLIICIISIMFISTGCSFRSVNNIEQPELEGPFNTELLLENNIYVNQVVDAACGQCQFGITGKTGCDLAVQIDGKSYFVDGTSIHDHGDAHADDGFCLAISKAEVKGEIIDGRFKAETFTIIK